MCIFTNNLSLLQAMVQGGISANQHNLIYQCRSEILKRHWVPSHCGIEGNEEADKLANEGALSNNSLYQVLLENTTQACPNDFQPIAKHWLVRDWQEQWVMDTMGRFTFSIFPRVKINPWFKDTNLKRSQIVFVNRVAANHFRRQAHLHRINIIESPLCACGENYDTPDHAIWDCLEVNRTVMFRWSQKYHVEFRTPIRSMIAMEKFEALAELSDSNTNIYN